MILRSCVPQVLGFVAIVLPDMALGATYSCASTHAYGWNGEVLGQWQAGIGTDGQIRFTFDTRTGEYVESMVGSAAAITGGGTLNILGMVEDANGRVVAASPEGSIVLKVFDTVHGVYYARLHEDAPVEIGACEKSEAQ